MKPTPSPSDNVPSLVQCFRDRWGEAAGEYLPVKHSGELEATLLNFLEDNSVRSVVIGGSPLTPAIGQILAGNVEILADFGSSSYDREEAIRLCSQADVGIGGVDALIADSGTLVVVSRNEGDRLISSLPPTHLVIALDAPVFSDMQAFLRIAADDVSLSFITGPSRTADIEKQLVVGAHGPVRVVVIGLDV